MATRKLSMKAMQQQLEITLQELARLREENDQLRNERSAPEVVTVETTRNMSESDNATENSCQVSDNNKGFKMGIHEVSVLIPEFNPQINPNVSAKDWLNNISQLKENYGWNDKTTLFYASLRVSGPARFWYTSTQNKLHSWTEFKSDMEKSFPDCSDDGDILFKIIHRKRKREECIENYLYEMVDLGKKIRLSEVSIMRYIITGVNDENLKGVLLASKSENVQELLKQIKNYEEMHLQGGGRNILVPVQNANIRDNQKRFRPYASTYKSRNQLGKENKVNQVDSRNKFVERKCFNCNKVGHYANNCPMKGRTCYNCHKQGHISKECKEKRMAVVDSLDRYPGDEYHVLVMIDDVQFVAFVDLGSCCNTVQKSIMTKYNWKLEPYHLILKGFGGARVVSLGKVTKSLILSGNEYDTELVVVEDFVQEIPIIIGRTLLDRPDVEIIKTYKKLQIRQNQNMLSINKDVVLINQDNITIEDVDKDTTERVVVLLNKFRNCISIKVDEIGKTKLVEMEIHLNQSQIISHKPYKVAYGLKHILKQNIDL